MIIMSFQGHGSWDYISFWFCPKAPPNSESCDAAFRNRESFTWPTTTSTHSSTYVCNGFWYWHFRAYFFVLERIPEDTALTVRRKIHSLVPRVVLKLPAVSPAAGSWCFSPGSGHFGCLCVKEICHRSDLLLVMKCWELCYLSHSGRLVGERTQTTVSGPGSSTIVSRLSLTVQIELMLAHPQLRTCKACSK